MSVVATRNDLMYPLFVCAHPEIGFYQIKFFVDGAWRVVSIDDYIPFISVRSKLYKMARCKDENEMWVPLVMCPLLFRIRHLNYFRRADPDGKGVRQAQRML